MQEPSDEDENEFIQPTPMPTIVQEEFMEAHRDTNRVDEAHPIDKETIERLDARTVGSMPFTLAALQAVADTADSFEEEYNNVRLLEETDDTLYYQVASQTFYQLCVDAYEQYEGHYTEIEKLTQVMEVHTRQLLTDLHGYEEDFDGREPTLCNAYNHDSPQDGAITMDDEPENGHYGFVDARGFIVTKNTHTEPSD